MTSAHSERVRRLVDVCASAVGLLLLAPVFGVIAYAVRRDSPGPVFYRATRIGRGGRPFTLYKFRSMVDGGADGGPAITAAGDVRITQVGRVLRGSKLDELPQLVNVLRGEMSLVGPRPEDPRYVALYDFLQRAVLMTRPGITSPASVHFRREEELLTGEEWEQRYVERILPAKLAIDLDYLRRRTVWSDLGVIVATLAPMRMRGGRA